jgi:hypothetical protein
LAISTIRLQSQILSTKIIVCIEWALHHFIISLSNLVTLSNEISVFQGPINPISNLIPFQGANRSVASLSLLSQRSESQNTLLDLLVSSFFIISNQSTDNAEPKINFSKSFQYIDFSDHLIAKV